MVGEEMTLTELMTGILLAVAFYSALEVRYKYKGWDKE